MIACLVIQQAVFHEMKCLALLFFVVQFTEQEHFSKRRCPDLLRMNSLLNTDCLHWTRVYENHTQVVVLFPTTYPLVNQHSHGNSSSFLVNTIQNGRWSIAMLGYQRETPGSLTARPWKFAIPKGSRIVFQPPLQVSINGGDAKHVRRDLAAEMLGVVPKFEGKRTTPFVRGCWKCQGNQICVIIDFRVYVMKHTS